MSHRERLIEDLQWCLRQLTTDGPTFDAALGVPLTLREGRAVVARLIYWTERVIEAGLPAEKEPRR